MSTNAAETTKLELEIEQLRRENERLDFELRNLRGEAPDLQKIRFYLPVLSWLISGLAIVASIATYIVTQRSERESRQLELRREAARPFWEKQLPLYLEAAEKAAFIAISENEKSRREAAERYWVLYWGPLAAVEDVGLSKPEPKVETAMVKFGELLTPDITNNREELRRASLELAHAIRDAADPAFQIKPSKPANTRDPKIPPTVLK